VVSVQVQWLLYKSVATVISVTTEVSVQVVTVQVSSYSD